MLLYVGQVEEATEVMGQLLAVDDPLPYDGMWLLAHMFLGEVVSLIGTPDQAAQQYRRLAPFAGRLGCIGTAVHPLRHAGTRGAGGTSGKPDLAAEHFAAAHAQHMRMNLPFWVAETELAWQVPPPLRSTGRGRELLRSAIERGEDNGFAGIVVEAAALLPDQSPAHGSGGATFRACIRKGVKRRHQVASKHAPTVSDFRT